MKDEARERRFWDKVNMTDDCWHWLGGTTPDGYGRFRSGNGNETAATRYCYEIVVEIDIPEGHLLYHGCGTPGCVRPDHMHVVTPAEHTALSGGPVGTNARKIKCVHGHPFKGKNLHIDIEGKRRCRTCSKRIAQEKAARFKGPRKPKPGKVTLQRKMKSMSNVELGEYYGVTDTAIRKWMKGYGLSR
jgi:hypothetical protein